jgi:hypothetical protein
MMHGPEKSDPGIVATKPTNKTEQSVAEPVERRAGTKGNAGQQSTHRTQRRSSVSQALERIRESAKRFAVTHPRWEPYAGKPLVRFCAGGAQQWASLPRRAPAASWCGPAGVSPAQVRGSVRLVASVAWLLATVVAKRTQQLHGVWD